MLEVELPNKPPPVLEVLLLLPNSPPVLALVDGAPKIDEDGAAAGAPNKDVVGAGALNPPMYEKTIKAK